MFTTRLNWQLLVIAFAFSLLAIAPRANEPQHFVTPETGNTSAQECSLQSLEGTYGFTSRGALVVQLPGYPPPPVLAVNTGTVTYDGAGNNWGGATTNLNGLVIRTGTFTGTHTVNPDCTFSGHHTGAAGGITNFVGTISGAGMLRQINFIVTNPGYVVYGTDYTLPPGGCSLSTLKGSYALSGQGTITANTPPSLVAHVGVATYDGAGNLAGNGTLALNGVMLPDTFTGAYAVDANCTVSLAITDSVLGVIHQRGRITREGQLQRLDAIITDPGFVFAEATTRQ